MTRRRIRRPFLVEDEWFAVFDYRLSPPFQSEGAAAAWLSICKKTGEYRS